MNQSAKDLYLTLSSLCPPVCYVICFRGALQRSVLVDTSISENKLAYTDVLPKS